MFVGLLIGDIVDRHALSSSRFKLSASRVGIMSIINASK